MTVPVIPLKFFVVKINSESYSLFVVDDRMESSSARQQVYCWKSKPTKEEINNIVMWLKVSMDFVINLRQMVVLHHEIGKAQFE